MDNRCRSGKNCTAKTDDGPAATAKPETICPACVVDIQRRLWELPHLAQALKTFLGGSMKIAYTSKVKASKAPAAPMNVVVADLLDEIREVTDQAGGPTVNIHTLILRPAELFTVWVKDVRQKKYLDGVDRALAIRRVHGRVSSMVGLHAVWERRAAPCPTCDQFTLGNWSGSDFVECTTEDCDLKMTFTQYEHHCIEKAQ